MAAAAWPAVCPSPQPRGAAHPAGHRHQARSERGLRVAQDVRDDGHDPAAVVPGRRATPTTVDPALATPTLQEISAQLSSRGYRRVARTEGPDFGVAVTAVNRLKAVNVGYGGWWGSGASSPAYWGYSGGGFARRDRILDHRLAERHADHRDVRSARRTRRGAPRASGRASRRRSRSRRLGRDHPRGDRRRSERRSRRPRSRTIRQAFIQSPYLTRLRQRHRRSSEARATSPSAALLVSLVASTASRDAAAARRSRSGRPTMRAFPWAAPAAGRRHLVRRVPGEVGLLSARRARDGIRGAIQPLPASPEHRHVHDARTGPSPGRRFDTPRSGRSFRPRATTCSSTARCAPTRRSARAWWRHERRAGERSTPA